MTTMTWTAGTSGLWTTATNWTPAQSPGTGDTALVTQAGAYLVSVTGTQTVGTLDLDDASGQVSVAGTLTAGTVTVAAGTLAVGGYLAATLTNAGIMSVSGAVDLTNLVNTGTLLNNGGVGLFGTVATDSLSRISGSGRLGIEGTLINAGTTLDASVLGQQQITTLGTVQGGTLLNFGTIGSSTLDGVTVQGTLAMAPGSSLTVLGGLTLTGTGGAGPGTLLLTTMIPEAPGTVTFVGSQTLDNAIIGGAGSILVPGGTLTLGNAATLSSSFILGSNPGFTFAGSGTVINNGTIITFSQQGLVSLHNDGAIQVSNTDFQNYGTLDARDITPVFTPGPGPDSGIAGTSVITLDSPTFTNHAGGLIEMGQSVGTAALTVAANTTFTNDGILLTQDSAASSTSGGTIDLKSLVAGSGTIELKGGGTVEIETAVSNTQTIDFIDKGTLLLDQPSFVPATINGFTSDDLIHLGVSATAISYTDGDLKLATGSGTVDLAITGTYGLSDFIINTQSASTNIQLACFATGTRLLTPSGAVAVEALREGDRMILANRTDTLPVTWIGRRQLDCRSHPAPHKVWPVRISAGAFAPNVPAQELWLSPDHAVFVHGVLVPVKYLVNGRTIVQQPVDRIGYWHVELAEHAILLAEGLAAESLLPGSDRSGFVNGGGAVALHPDFGFLGWEARGCAELIVVGPVLDKIRAQLQRRARRLAGHKTTASQRRSGARHRARAA